MTYEKPVENLKMSKAIILCMFRVYIEKLEKGVSYLIKLKAKNTL